jgi:hypothetical protein
MVGANGKCVTLDEMNSPELPELTAAQKFALVLILVGVIGIVLAYTHVI